MSTENQKLDTCGCCEGLRALTPASVENLPGLAAIAYRVGTHGSFKVTMKSQLSAQRSLRALTTRDDHDHAIGLIDGWATVADVLTFYQERIANEGYLRTATERRSILELARLIGYELNPGVAASTYLAFTVEQAQVSPARTNGALTIGQVPSSGPSTRISIGAKAQSVPGQDESPQVFETVEEIEARGEWNAIRPLLAKTHEFGRRTTGLYLKGTDTRLKPGDAILLVGEEREQNPFSERWDFRILQSVAADSEKDCTVVTWEEDPGHKNPSMEPVDNPKIYALRLRSALFGHNAPDWFAVSDSLRKAYLVRADESINDYDVDDPSTWGPDWPSSIFKTQTVAENRIDLDAAYPEILQDSWIVLVKPNYVELYKAVEVDVGSRTDFSLTSKTTRIKLDMKKHLSWFGLRETVVFAESEQLTLAKEPVTIPVFGDKIVIDRIKHDLDQGRTLIINGRRLQRVKVTERTHVFKVGKTEKEAEDKLFLVSADRAQLTALESGDVLKVEDSPEWTPQGMLKWYLTNEQNTSGFVIAEPDDLVPADEKKEVAAAGQSGSTGIDADYVSEVVSLDGIETDSENSTLFLAESLRNVYCRDTVTINANVCRATHGEAKVEVLGSGDGSREFQEFVLKQNPLTFVAASTPKGAETTLKVRVNDVLWKEVPTFFGHGPNERIYITRMNDDGKMRVIFGDGRTGARLPSGQENVRAEYRKGIGLSGLMRAKQISQLMTRPLGVKEVINPIAATGADDPEKRDKARQNAPLTVLTLDRIVSLQDFEDFARAFAGIGKAQATMLWNGEQRMVHITVSAAGGRSVEKGSELHKKLIEGINAARHADQQIMIHSYDPLEFNVEALVHVDRSLIVENVMNDVLKAIREAFGFDRRNFGQAVTKSEVMGVIQRVSGVVALDLEHLYFSPPDGETAEPGEPPPFLPAHIARWDEQNVSIKPAQLLTVNTSGIVLGEMKV